jgi:hypothetical protein
LKSINFLAKKKEKKLNKFYGFGDLEDDFIDLSGSKFFDKKEEYKSDYKSFENFEFVSWFDDEFVEFFESPHNANSNYKKKFLTGLINKNLHEGEEVLVPFL